MIPDDAKAMSTPVQHSERILDLYDIEKMIEQ